MDNIIQIASLILSAFATILVAVIGYFGNNRLEIIRRQGQTMTIELEREKIKAEQDAKKEKFITEYVPKIISTNEHEMRTAIAVLFIIYPNDAQSILERIAPAFIGWDRETNLKQYIQKAKDLAKETGPWTIVISSDLTLQEAKYESEKAKNQGYSPIIIYKKGKWYATTVGNYPNQDSAEIVIVDIRSKIKKDAFIVNIKNWCSEIEDKDEYFECLSD